MKEQEKRFVRESLRNATMEHKITIIRTSSNCPRGGIKFPVRCQASERPIKPKLP